MIENNYSWLIKLDYLWILPKPKNKILMDNNFFPNIFIFKVVVVVGKNIKEGSLTET